MILQLSETLTVFVRPMMFWLYRWGLYLRTVLLILICMARNALWGLEQPANSLLVKHPRFEWLANHVCYVTWPIGFLCIIQAHAYWTTPCGNQGILNQVLDAAAWEPNTQTHDGIQLYGGDWEPGFGKTYQRGERTTYSERTCSTLVGSVYESLKFFKLISFYPCLPPEKEFVIIVGEMICAPGD